MRSVRALLTASLLSVLMTAPAQEQTEIAGLTVVAFGEQEVDIFTGVTTLPQGGKVIDRQNGITLSAEELSYLEGQFIEATGVELIGAFGDASAESLYVDLEAGLVTGSGQVRFENDDVSIEASAFDYDVDEQVLTFDGPVTGTGLEFEAAAMVLDIASESILLVGPYSYQDELFQLSSEQEGALLSLQATEEDDPAAFVASTRVDPEIVDRLSPYLP